MVLNVSVHDNISCSDSIQSNNIYLNTHERVNNCFAYRRPVGTLLGQAPCLDQGLFKGRSSELYRMEEVLRPRDEIPQQRKVVLRGLGGIGKTQLAIEYAKRHRNTYDSILFLNAESMTSLNASFRSLANNVFSGIDHASLNDNQLLGHINGWLSDPKNPHWLLIFDSYDNPDQFRITNYYPSALHGSIIITTRRPHSYQGIITVQPIESIEDNLAIFRSRCGRLISSSDTDAINLVKQFKGLPLAIVTTGEYLRASSISFRQILQDYNNHVNIEQYQHVELDDYPGRTLYTTWDRSYHHLEWKHSEAAKLLKLLAYFSHQRFWYELFRVGVGKEHPRELREMMANEITFDRAMRILGYYSFINIQPELKSWTMHPCVHNWIVAKLNKETNLEPPRYAFRCITKSLTSDNWEAFGCPSYSHLALHAAWLVQQCFTKGNSMYKITSGRHIEVWSIAILLYRQGLWNEAKKWLKVALKGIESGPYLDENCILVTMHSLGRVYATQGNLPKAEQMFLGAREMGENCLGTHHLFTLSAFRGLGEVYHRQGKFTDAEQMFEQFRGRLKPEIDPYTLLIESEALKFADSPANWENRKEQSKLIGTSLLEWACLLQ